jgi:hypothetical protein
LLTHFAAQMKLENWLPAVDVHDASSFSAGLFTSSSLSGDPVVATILLTALPGGVTDLAVRVLKP